MTARKAAQDRRLTWVANNKVAGGSKATRSLTSKCLERVIVLRPGLMTTLDLELSSAAFSLTGWRFLYCRKTVISSLL
jgi:hypothetical protein